MVSDLVEGKVLRALIVRLNTDLQTELARLGARDTLAVQAAGAVGVGRDEAVEVSSQLQAWLESDEAAKLDERAPVIMPSSAIPSLIQSAFEERFVETDLVVDVPLSQGLSPAQTPSTTMSLAPDLREMLIGNRNNLAGRYIEQFAERDARFLTWGIALKLATLLRGKRKFESSLPSPVRISNTARVIIVGDWGSGVPRAQQVGRFMSAAVAAAEKAGREVHVIHLGDVYYTGLASEYDRRFLAYWPVKPGQASTVGSWCLNANHDMYSGGHAYFDHLLKDPRFKRQERRSFFHLENDHWQLLGLDSAYEDGDLHGPQAGWVESVRRASPKKKGMLLSHHQLFSPWAGDSTAMVMKTAGVLSEGLVTAWLWGHEHRCAFYRPTSNLKYPRVIGHGGVPVWASEGDLPNGVESEYRDSFTAYNEQFARFGFAQLDFTGDGRIDARYINELGQEHLTEEMS